MLLLLCFQEGEFFKNKIHSACFVPHWPQQTPPVLAAREANMCSLLAQPRKGLQLPQPHIPA